jgi:hypothetical protein
MDARRKHADRLGSGHPGGGLLGSWTRVGPTPGRYSAPTRPALVATTRARDQITFESGRPRFPPDCLRLVAAGHCRHASIASDRWPAIPGGVGHHHDHDERFPSCAPYIPPFLPELCLTKRHRLFLVVLGYDQVKYSSSGQTKSAWGQRVGPAAPECYSRQD